MYHADRPIDANATANVYENGVLVGKRNLVTGVVTPETGGMASLLDWLNGLTSETVRIGPAAGPFGPIVNGPDRIATRDGLVDGPGIHAPDVFATVSWKQRGGTHKRFVKVTEVPELLRWLNRTTRGIVLHVEMPDSGAVDQDRPSDGSSVDCNRRTDCPRHTGQAA